MVQIVTDDFLWYIMEIDKKELDGER